jgi:hypothetical protein
LGGNMFGDGHIREHPLVADRWLRVDAADKVTVAEGPWGTHRLGVLPPSRGHAVLASINIQYGTPSDPTCC